MKSFAVVFLCLVAAPAHAKDIVIILDDAAQRDLIVILDTARKQAQSLDIVEPVARTWQRLKAAPEMIAHEDKAPPAAAATPTAPTAPPRIPEDSE